MSRLSWISDEKFDCAVSQLRESCKNAREQAHKRIEANVIDPFLSLVIASSFDIKKSEELRSLKSINSAASGMAGAVGKFHQQILASVNGWTNHDSGYDLENSEGKIIAEIKNKHNTMNAQNKKIVIDELKIAIKQKKSKKWQHISLLSYPKRSNDIKNR